MKIALIAETMLDYATAFANAVAPHGKTSLIVPARILGHHRSSVAPSVDLRCPPWPRLRAPGNAVFAMKLLKLLRALDPDIVHVVSQTLVWPSIVLPLRGRARLVETVHDVKLHPGDRETARIPKAFTSLLRAQADAFFVHSEAMREAAAQVWRVPRQRIFVVPHLALTRYAALALRSPPPFDAAFDVLFFGRIQLYKGLEHLIAAAEQIGARIPGLRVTIAGQGPDLARCRALIKTPSLFDIRDRHVADEEVALLFQRTNVVALPYIEASQSGVAAIAASFGKAVVATDVGDFRESLGGPDGFALIVPPANPSALASALLRLSEEPSLRQSFEDAALRKARGPWNAASVGASAAQAYAEICRANTAERPLHARR
jgi:glycosyltransferase involved in cell wall biosynthesis